MKRSKSIDKIIWIVFAVVFSCAAIYFIFNIIFSPYWNSVYAPAGYLSLVSMSAAESDEIIYTKEQACEDLDYMFSCLNRVHPDYKDGVSENVQKCLEEQKESLNDQVTTLELWRCAASLFNSTGDSNCIVEPSFTRHFLVDYLKKNNEGYRVTKINDMSIDEIFQKNSCYFSYELESWGKNSLRNCFQSAEGLEFIGFDADNLKFEYQDRNNNYVTEIYNKSDFADYQTASEQFNDIQNQNKSYYSNIEKSKNVAVLTINYCEFDTVFKEFLYQFFTEVIENNIQNVVVDIRKNSGGTTQVADEFLLYLTAKEYVTPSGTWRLGPYLMNWESQNITINHYDETQFGGSLYILTSSETFSSAEMFAEIIQANKFGVIVGEPCGSKPDCCDDPVVFQTPNSLLTFQVSSKRYYRIDNNTTDEPLVPDVECPQDEALEKVYELIAKS